MDGDRLSDDEVARYQADGYLSIDDFATYEDVTYIREVFRRRFNELGNGAPDTVSNPHATLLESSGDVRVQSVRDRHGRIAWAEVFQPELDDPRLLDTSAFRRGLAAASQLLETGQDDIFWESNFMLRTGNAPTGTYWHQDEGYMDPAFDYRLVTVWVALHETTPDCGMMHFVPGSHLGGVVSHQQGSRPGAVDDIPADAVVACPLRAGGATLHSGRTLHYTNLARQRRFNYIIRFNGPPTPRDAPYDRPWYLASELRREKLTLAAFGRA